MGMSGSEKRMIVSEILPERRNSKGIPQHNEKEH